MVHRRPQKPSQSPQCAGHAEHHCAHGPTNLPPCQGQPKISRSPGSGEPTEPWVTLSKAPASPWLPQGQAWARCAATAGAGAGLCLLWSSLTSPGTALLWAQHSAPGAAGFTEPSASANSSVFLSVTSHFCLSFPL